MKSDPGCLACEFQVDASKPFDAFATGVWIGMSGVYQYQGGMAFCHTHRVALLHALSRTDGAIERGLAQKILGCLSKGHEA
jgi:hypothetical protein